MVEIILAIIAAFVAGFVDAIAGGGGIISLPTLRLLGLPPDLAVATNKLVASCGATSAMYTYIRSKRCAWDVLRLAAPFTAVGALGGAIAVIYVPPQFLDPFIAFVVLAVAIYFTVRHELGLRGTYRGLTISLGLLAAGAALVLGFYDGFVGPGVGAFLMVVFVRGLGFDFLYAAGNTKVLNWISNVVSLCFFLAAGKVVFTVGLPMMPANLLGGYLGARFAVRRGSAWVRAIFVLMALALVARLLWQWAGRASPPPQ